MEDCLRRSREGIVVGVDEAGRGSIIGEMFVVAYAAPLESGNTLRELGVRDSKELSPRSRAKLYRTLASMGVFSVASVEPQVIDRDNLNILTEKAVIRALKSIATRLGGWGCIAAIIVDKFGSPRMLPLELRRLGYKGVIIVEERADKKYPHVSAASIIAKHLRDTRMHILSSLYGVEGSGYPSDPRTMRWVRETLESGRRPPIIRYSWASLRKYGFGRKTGSSRTLDEWLDQADNRGV